MNTIANVNAIPTPTRYTPETQEPVSQAIAPLSVQIKGNRLLIDAPIIEKGSSTGKMLLIANTGGWQFVPVTYRGSQVKLNLTAGISTK